MESNENKKTSLTLKHNGNVLYIEPNHLHNFDGNEYIEKARLFLKNEQIDYLLVNSTNEFLVEYNELQKNSRYYLTGFTGSTGDALVSKDNVYLFVDGRYHIQADLEVNHDDITVVKLELGKFIDELYAIIKENSTIGICSKKNSQWIYETFTEKFKDKTLREKEEIRSYYKKRMEMYLLHM